MNYIKQFIKNIIWGSDWCQFSVKQSIENAIAEERPKIMLMAQKDFMETMADDLNAQAEELSKK